MPTYNTVKPADLIDHCMRYYREGWGYIYGAYGQIWTQEKQNAATDEQTKKYGQQWVGKHVIDCSGVWYLAMKELGSYMYHGSNTMWNSYTVSKGRLSAGKRTDGQDLKPATAIFTGINDGDHNHVGIYIGNGQVLEAGGVQKGVIITSITLSKWTCWGEMKYVDYSGSGSSPSPWRPTVRRGSRGEDVKYVQQKLKELGYDIGASGVDGIFGAKTEAAVRAFQKARGLAQDGVVGPMTYDALDNAKPTEEKYTVTIPNMTKAQADAIIAQYPAATKKKEG